MEWNKKLIVMNDLIERDLGDELVLMTSDGKEIHSLEKTALWIWTKIKEEIVPEEIISLLMEEYSVEKKQAEDDFEIFIEMLKEKGIVN